MAGAPPERCGTAVAWQCSLPRGQTSRLFWHAWRLSWGFCSRCNSRQVPPSSLDEVCLAAYHAWPKELINQEADHLHGGARSEKDKLKRVVGFHNEIWMWLQVEKVPDQEWMDSVRSSYQPTQITDSMWIIPRCASPLGPHARLHLPGWRAASASLWRGEAWPSLLRPQFHGLLLSRWCEPPNPAAVNIVLEPGLAFGTGEHPTTRLCLRALSCMPLSGTRVMDYGTGAPDPTKQKCSQYGNTCLSGPVGLGPWI